MLLIIGSLSLWNDRLGLMATMGGLPLPDGSMGQSEMHPYNLMKSDRINLFSILSPSFRKAKAGGNFRADLR